MVAIEAPQRHTVTEIYEGYERENQQWDSISLSISLVGSECDRALWYALRWASPPEKLTGQKLRLFKTGYIEEDRLIEDLRRAGFEVWATDEAGKQFKTFLLGGHVRGKMDGVVQGVPEAPGKPVVVEFKSHNDRSFKDVVKKGVKDAKPNHYAQCQLYCHSEKVEACLYLAVNKNNDELHAELIPFDAEFCDLLLARIAKIINTARAPARIAEDASKWPCVLCQHKAVCHQEIFGRKTCRSCVFSTPVIGESNDAAWTCAKHGSLDLNVQKIGCDDHLYLPDVVPGEQTDAGDNWIEYTLKDGSVWVDRGVA